MARALLNDDDVFPVREKDLDLDIQPDEDAVYYLRAITAETARTFFKKHTKPVPNPRTHQREDRTDRVALQDDLYDYCLVKWEGIAGSPPCTTETKKQLPMVLQAALLERAQIGTVTPEQKAASFREPADVVPVLQG